MNRVYDFLKKAGTYYLATVEGDQPRVRPFGTALLFEDKIYIQTGKIKPVAKQIASNPGGIIIDTRGFKASTNEIFQSLLYRLKRSSNNSIDIIIFMKGQDPTVYRYKKR